MYCDALQKLEGVWVGRERVDTGDARFEATGRWVFHTVFDGLFLLCDYVQTAPDRPHCVGHAVFRKDDRTQALTVSWFRSPTAATHQQIDGVAEGDRLCFYEKQGDTSTRTRYAIYPNGLTITTERSVCGGKWQQVFEGSYRRPRVSVPLLSAGPRLDGERSERGRRPRQRPR
jgi:hypothetical protein